MLSEMGDVVHTAVALGSFRALEPIRFLRMFYQNPLYVSGL